MALRSRGEAGPTLLEELGRAGDADYAGKPSESFAAEDPAASEPTSPFSPLAHAVRKNSISQAGVAVVHRVSLSSFRESRAPTDPNAPRRRIIRASSIGGGAPAPPSSAGERPAFRKRASSVGSLGTFGVDDDDGAPARARGAAARPPSAGRDGDTVRPVSSQEMVRRDREAVDWFRASRAINRRVRSIEDTETLLAAARVRRENGTDLITRRKSKEVPLGLPPPQPEAGKEAAPEEAKEAAAPAPVKRRSVDAAALWAAKPVAPQPKPEQPRLEQKRSSLRGEVAVGATGEDGLKARLRRRSTIN